jgi:hypothetical protein
MYELQEKKREMLPRANPGTIFQITDDAPNQLTVGDEETSFSWKREEAVVEVQCQGWLLVRERQISFEEIRDVRFEHYTDDVGQHLTTIELCREDERYSQTVPIRGIDTQEKASGLLFRIAAIIGWRGYIIGRRSESYIEIELSKELPAQTDPFRTMAFEDRPQVREIPLLNK